MKTIDSWPIYSEDTHVSRLLLADLFIMNTHTCMKTVDRWPIYSEHTYMYEYCR